MSYYKIALVSDLDAVAVQLINYFQDQVVV